MLVGEERVMVGAFYIRLALLGRLGAYRQAHLRQCLQYSTSNSILTLSIVHITAPEAQKHPQGLADKLKDKLFKRKAAKEKA